MSSSSFCISRVEKTSISHASLALDDARVSGHMTKGLADRFPQLLVPSPFKLGL